MVCRWLSIHTGAVASSYSGEQDIIEALNHVDGRLYGEYRAASTVHRACKGKFRRR